MPAAPDRLLRLFLVTPDMHRIRQSRDAGESLLNFGGTFPW
jgi:hypothetical protein